MKTALLVIDVQNCFLNENTKELPQKIASYIATHKHDYVLFTRFINKQNSNFYKKLNWKECMESPDIDICPLLMKYINEDNIFDKSTYSAFKSSVLLNFIKTNNIDKLFLCGLDADACVLATAFEGFDLGLDITVVTDLISSGEQKMQAYVRDIVKRNIQL